MDLNRLLAPSSIAVVGASERPSIGRTIVRSLGVMGYGGAIHPVHPRYPEILGHACVSSLSEIAGEIDLVAICLGRDRVVAEVEKAAGKGAGAVIIYAAGFAEAGEEGRGQQARIVELCRAHDMVLCGPNCMGVMSLHAGSHAYMLDVIDADRLIGNVGLISQSGSVSIGMLADTRRYGFSHVISTGNEAVTDTAQYMEYLIDDPDTGIIALFSESVRDPDRFVAALDRAFDAGKPVVVLKAGKSERAAAAVVTHTGGLAGESRVFSAVLRSHNAIEVDDLEEMAEVLSVCQGRHWPRGGRLAVVTGSGGHAELMLDKAAGAGIDLPPLAPSTRSAIEAGIGPLTGDGNPVDAWGQGDFAANFTVALREVASCGDYDAAILSLDAHDGQAVDYEGQDQAVNRVLAAAQERHPIPFYLMSTRHGIHRSAQVRELRETGIAAIGGVTQGLRAIGRVARWVTGARPPDAPAPGRSGAPEWAARASVHELDAKRLLAGAGIAVPRGRLVTSPEDALEAAGEIGYPVVMKVVGDTLPHRSEHGLVELHLDDADAVASAWDRLRRRLSAMGRAADGACLAVQETAAPGVEVIAGVARDPAFGLVMAVGPGGILAELFDDVAMCCLPAREGDLEALVGGGRLGAQLLGLRGAEASDTGALLAALRGLADFATAHAPWIEAIDVNPLVVHSRGRGCTAVDALIVPSSGSTSEP